MAGRQIEHWVEVSLSAPRAFGVIEPGRAEIRITFVLEEFVRRQKVEAAAIEAGRGQ